MAKGGKRRHAGPRKKPTALKVLQGTFRPDRHGAEVQVRGGFPAPPVYLDDEERARWEELRGLCEPWTAPSDVFAIHGVVSIFGLLRKCQIAQRASAEAGQPLAFSYTVTADGDGDEKKHVEIEAKENPLISQEVKLWRELRAYIAITGLSPVDRAKVAPAGAGDDTAQPSTLSRLLKKGGA